MGFKNQSFERQFSQQFKMRFLQQTQIERNKFLKLISHFIKAEGKPVPRQLCMSGVQQL